MNKRRTKKDHLLVKMGIQYREETGNDDGAMESGAFAEWLLKRGWRAPRARTPKELLMRDISQAFRKEYRTDEAGGFEYRANIAFRKTVQTEDGLEQFTFWIDPDRAPKRMVHQAFSQRKSQIFGEVFGLANDLQHFNSARGQAEGQINMTFDFNVDIEEERALRRDQPPEKGEHDEGDEDEGL